MPPVRTAKKNTSSGAKSLASDRPKKKTPVNSLPKGLKDARFGSASDWDGKYEQVIGTSTRNIIFNLDFALTDDHINKILALGDQICENIWQFIFEYHDVSYGAKNTAHTVTNDAVVRLGKACPKLRKFQLQGTTHVTDDALLSLFENCPNLTSVEVSGDTTLVMRDECSGSALDQLREHPEWAPKLKKLILSEKEDNKNFMKAMRSLGKGRTELTIVLQEQCEVKKWGDWEISILKKTYKKGRRAR